VGVIITGSKEKNLKNKKCIDLFVAALCIMFMGGVSLYFSLLDYIFQKHTDWEKSVL
jgi:type III secretory pathway component EscU